MADYIDGSSSEQAGISRRSLIKKGMIAGGVGLWAVPVVAAVTRNSGSGDGAVQHEMVPANHGGAPVANCGVAGSGPGCITFVCTGATPTYVECVGTPIGNPQNGPDICFCDTDIAGNCRCFANEDCADLINCPNLGAPNGGCPAGFFCVNPFSCCLVAKCARVCA